jgi:cytochrome P450
MRLLAIVGPRRITNQEVAHICGRHVPGNGTHSKHGALTSKYTHSSQTFVVVNQYPAFPSSSNFTQPNAFVPERLLAISPFASYRMYAFEPFLLGRHKCIGQELAWTIIHLTLARLIFTLVIHAVGELGDFDKPKT